MSASVKVRLSDFDNDDVIEYVSEDLGKMVIDTDDEAIDYLEDKGYAVILASELESKEDDKRMPCDYIDTPAELREHLISILGMGHYRSNAEIVEKVREILG